MLPSKGIGSDKKTAQLAAKLVFNTARKEEEFVSKIKEA